MGRHKYILKEPKRTWKFTEIYELQLKKNIWNIFIINIQTKANCGCSTVLTGNVQAISY